MIVHINDKGDVQTAEDHLAAIGDICFNLGDKLCLGNVCFLAGILHDLGKNKKEFEEYLIQTTEKPGSRSRGEVDHSTAGGQFIFKFYDGEIFRNLTDEIIAMSIFSHHGIMDYINTDGSERFLGRTEKQNISYDEVIKNSSEFLNKYDIESVFDKAVNEIKTIYGKIMNFLLENKCAGGDGFFMLGLIQRLVSSILIDADRIDTDAFMTGDKPNKINDYEKLWKGYIEKLDIKLKEFGSNTDKISLLRRKMSDECWNFAKNSCGIYCLPVPTGGGKTLASLRFALEHCRLHNKKRIIYTAPYLSILEQNASEIKNILKDDENIFEHHSNIFFDNDDETDCYKFLAGSWESPVILTSMVRLFEVMFSGDTPNIRRFNKLSDSVIIIDEIQNLPVKTINLFNMTANFLSCFCNVTIILCSATQPLLAEAEKKIIYGNPVNMINDVETVRKSFRRVRIIDKTRPEQYSATELADFIFENIDENMLVILNTKNAVNLLADELTYRDSDYKIYRLTTYMCPQNRIDIISEIKEKLGSEKIICVSTQLIEAGVDISFNNVIRSLAGMDSIIQAAGRCNRNGTDGIKNVYIINSSDENLSGLEDIKKGKESTEKLLYKYKNNKEALGEDYLLSSDAINYFYENYFFNRKNEMSYNIKKDIIIKDLY
ncbi:MAG: CRISPR-associated helicase Cas3', partial [Clostridiales bacterium]|nr:CRISPR-associated helicase Cas3' [Clostridiales bacterium]